MFRILRKSFLFLLFLAHTTSAQWIHSPPISSNDLTSIKIINNKGCILSPIELFLYNENEQIWQIRKNAGIYEFFLDAAFVDNDFSILTSQQTQISSIYISTDKGNSWENKKFGSSFDYKEVLFRGSTGWILPFDGPLLKTSNGGETWIQLENNYFDDISFVDENIGFAVSGLRIYKSTDGGSNWFVKYSETSGSPFYGINFSDHSTWWAYGGNGKLFKSNDGGENWISLTTIIQTNLESSFFLNNNVGWIGGWIGIFKTTDGGTNWIDITPSLGYQYHISSIYFKNNNEGLFCNSSNAVYKTIDGGTSWIEENNLEARKIIFVNSQLGYSAGNQDKIYKTTDSGITWTQQLTQNYKWSDLTSIHFVNANEGWSVGYNSTMYHTTNGGEDWKILQSSKLPELISISAINSDNIWIGGKTGIILKISNEGELINHQFSRSSDPIEKIFFVDENNGWAISQLSDTILKTTNGGMTWTKIITNSIGTIKSIYFIDSNTGWLLDDYYNWTPPPFDIESIKKTSDGGNSWQTISSIFDTTYNKILFVNQNEGYLIGDHGSILKTTNAGHSWNSTNSGVTEPLNDIALGNHIYIVGNNGVLLKSANSTRTDNDIFINYFELSQNYPNPFNPITKINYSVPSSSLVTLRVYDVLGNEVVELVNKEQRKGNYTVIFNGNNLASGVYFYKLNEGEYTITKKLILMK